MFAHDFRTVAIKNKLGGLGLKIIIEFVTTLFVGGTISTTTHHASITGRRARTKSAGGGGDTLNNRKSKPPPSSRKSSNKPERSQSFHIKCDNNLTTYYEVEYNNQEPNLRSSSVPKEGLEADPGSSQIYQHLEDVQNHPVTSTPYKPHPPPPPNSYFTLQKRKPSPLLGSVILAQKIQQER